MALSAKLYDDFQARYKRRGPGTLGARRCRVRRSGAGETGEVNKRSAGADE